MAIPPITVGSLNWGTPVNDRFTNLDTRLAAMESAFGPGDQTLDAWSFDPASNLVAAVLPTATISWIKVPIRATSFNTVTINSIGILVTTAGASLTVGQNFAGIYDAAGTLLGTTADQAVNWQSTGMKDMALTAPVVLTSSTYVYVALLVRGTTGPSLPRGSSLTLGAQLVNWNLTATTARYSILATAATSLPGSVDLSTRTLDATAWWAGVR
jgi:hypothetical protein